jgi:hypothetical protein
MSISFTTSRINDLANKAVDAMRFRHNSKGRTPAAAPATPAPAPERRGLQDFPVVVTFTEDGQYQTASDAPVPVVEVQQEAPAAAASTEKVGRIRKIASTIFVTPVKNLGDAADVALTKIVRAPIVAVSFLARLAVLILASIATGIAVFVISIGLLLGIVPPEKFATA